MVELTDIASPHSPSHVEPRMPDRVAAVPTVAGLAPDERLRSDLVDPDEDVLLSVVDGVVYAMLDEDDFVLMPGDRIVIPAGEPRRIWNAGDDTARVVTERR